MVRIVLGLVIVSMFLLSPAPQLAPPPNSQSDIFTQPPTTEVSEETKTEVIESYGRLPLLFIQNQGQVDEQVEYYAKGTGQTVFLTNKGLVFDLVRSQTTSDDIFDRRTAERLSFSLNFLNANSSPTIEGMGKEKLTTNYFIGNNPERWHTDVPNYQEVIYHDIYPNIDLRLYDKNGMLTYDFIVHPGGNVNDIRLEYQGVDSMGIEEEDLVLSTHFGEMRQQGLCIYQVEEEIREELTGNFVALSPTTYGFNVASYDTGKDVVIDPLFIYSTYLGGDWDDIGGGIAIDSSGYAYIAGLTYSTDFPTQNYYSNTNAGNWDVFVAKLDTTKAGLSSLVYSTYLGGNDYDFGIAIDIDSAGCAYVAGFTLSPDFPIQNQYQTDQLHWDAFVTKLNAQGNALVYSTYLGGDTGADLGYSLAIDSSGCAYVTGWTGSTDFPTLNPYQGSYKGGTDAFITKLNPTGDNLTYSTYLGDTGDDLGIDIAIDSAGCAYVSGFTLSPDFPMVNSYNGTYGGNQDGFVAKLNPAGDNLTYSTYLGGSDDDSLGSIATDSSGCAYVYGTTNSTNFPMKNQYQTDQPGQDIVVVKLDTTKTAASSLIYSTYLGGSSDDFNGQITIDSSGCAYVTGSVGPANYPILSPLLTPRPLDYQINPPGSDVFVAKLDPTKVGVSSLIYYTEFGGNDDDRGGGIAIDDSSGHVYITGYTYSTDFTTTSNAFQKDDQPGGDAFVTKLLLVDNQQIPSATGTGIVTFSSSEGTITDLSAIAPGDTDCPGNPVHFPHGLFSFNVIGITPGSTITITITLPSPIAKGTQYWKCINGRWFNFRPFLGDDDGDNVLTLTVTDGGREDADGQADGIFTDPGGPAVTIPAPAASGVSPTIPRSLNPSKMSVQYVSVNPQQAYANQSVTITTNVVNTGDEAGNLNVALKINGMVEQSRMVSVGPQGTQPVKFAITKNLPGTYTVDIAGQKSSFIILGNSSGTSSHQNAGLIAIFIVGVLVIVVSAMLIQDFRRSTH